LQENLLKTLDSVLWGDNLVTNSSWVLEDLMIVTTLVALVTIEMNNVIVFLNILQAETFVPSFWEDIKRNLSSNRELQVQTIHLLLESEHECLSDSSSLIVVFESVPLLLIAVSSDWGDVHHSISVFKERSSLDWDVQVSDVSQTEVNQLLQVVLTNMVLKALSSELLSLLHSEQAIL
jgi:hypothetical protein